VNLFVEIDLLDEARRLRTIVKAEQEKRWLEQNQAALAAYNARVSAQGLLSDETGLL
jgi:post-segregation antitoxin (ccd killing protein)